ncbi:MAG: phosphohydrolase, partial [Bacillota bacterium]
GWVLPSSNNEEIDEQDEKIYRREIMRLEMSLKSMENNNNQKLVMFHYMPVNERHEKNEFIELLIDYKVDTCVYGHLHGKESHKIRIAGEKWGINFQLVSADYLNFTPELIYSQD